MENSKFIATFFMFYSMQNLMKHRYFRKVYFCNSGDIFIFIAFIFYCLISWFEVFQNSEMLTKKKLVSKSYSKCPFHKK